MSVENWSAELTKYWKQAQENHWKSVPRPSAATGSSPITHFPNITEDLEQWWSLLSPQMPKQADDVMRQAINMGKSFDQFAESFIKAKDENKNPLDSWLDSMEKRFKAWSSLPSQGNMGFVPFAADSVAIPNWHNFMEKLTGKPQESLYVISDLAEKYREAMNAYISALSAKGLDSVQQLRERMMKMEKAGESIKSLRELYEMWIDVSEEVYDKFTLSKEFQDVYGDVVNSFVAFKAGIDSVVESQLKSSNTPTQKTQDELLKQLQQEKRVNESLREQIKALKESAPTVMTKPDDLKEIKGIGPVLQKALAAIGIQSFKQLATLSPNQAQALDEKLEIQGRSLRDDWVGQAKQLTVTLS